MTDSEIIINKKAMYSAAWEKVGSNAHPTPQSACTTDCISLCARGQVQRSHRVPQESYLQVPKLQYWCTEHFHVFKSLTIKLSY